jgi:hypothetical protein
MIIDCKNAIINIKQDYQSFIEALNESEREFIKTFEFDENKGVYKTNWDLDNVAYNEITFTRKAADGKGECNSGKDWRDIRHCFKDMSVLFKD